MLNRSGFPKYIAGAERRPQWLSARRLGDHVLVLVAFADQARVLEYVQGNFERRACDFHMRSPAAQLLVGRYRMRQHVAMNADDLGRDVPFL